MNNKKYLSQSTLNNNSLKYPYQIDISNPNNWINKKNMSVNAVLHHIIIARKVCKNSNLNRTIGSAIFPKGDHVKVSSTKQFSLEIQDMKHKTTYKYIYLILPADVKAFSTKSFLNKKNNKFPIVTFANNTNLHYNSISSKEVHRPSLNNNLKSNQSLKNYNIIMHNTFNNINQKLKQIQSKK